MDNHDFLHITSYNCTGVGCLRWKQGWILLLFFFFFIFYAATIFGAFQACSKFGCSVTPQVGGLDAVGFSCRIFMFNDQLGARVRLN